MFGNKKRDSKDNKPRRTSSQKRKNEKKKKTTRVGVQKWSRQKLERSTPTR